MSDLDMNILIDNFMAENDVNGTDGSQELESVKRLKAHLAYLRSLTPEEALSALGRSGPDNPQTPFGHSFSRTLPLFPAVEHWTCYLNLVCEGLKLGAPGSDKDCLARTFVDMQASTIDIPSKIYLLVIRTMLTPFPPSQEGHKGTISSTSFLKVAGFVEDMSFRGHDITTEELRNLLEIGLIRATAPPATTTLAAGSLSSTDLAQRGLLHPRIKPKFRRVLESIFHHELPSLTLEIEKLRVCGSLEHWYHSDCGIWDVWRSFAVNFRPRPKELYLAMFDILAERGHQARTMDALRILIPDMDAEENPSMEMDDELAEVILKCLRVIERDIDRIAATDWYSKDEWCRLWRRCDAVMQERDRFLREYDDD